MKLDDDSKQAWKGALEPGGPLERALGELNSITASKELKQRILRKDFSSSTSRSQLATGMKLALPALALVLFFFLGRTPEETAQNKQIVAQNTLSETDLVELAYFIEDIALDGEIYLEDIELEGDEWLLLEETL